MTIVIALLLACILLALVPWLAQAVASWLALVVAIFALSAAWVLLPPWLIAAVIAVAVILVILLLNKEERRIRFYSSTPEDAVVTNKADEIYRQQVDAEARGDHAEAARLSAEWMKITASTRARYKQR